jgi:hypothetical protein
VVLEEFIVRLASDMFDEDEEFWEDMCYYAVYIVKNESSEDWAKWDCWPIGALDAGNSELEFCVTRLSHQPDHLVCSCD